MTILRQHKQLILYVVLGGLTTLVNVLVYYLLIACSLYYAVSNAIAIGVAIIFAYITNKIYVFESVTKGFQSLTLEFAKFIGSRAVSSIFDMLSMFILISKLHCGELISKIITGLAVVVMNYILSKKYAFSN